MNFLALLLGLAVERALTNLFHLREFHWLDPLFDRVLRAFASGTRVVAFIGVILTVALLVLPVIAAQIALSEGFAHIPGFVLAVVVLLFCLGPRDLIEEVDAYCAAVSNDDKNEIQRLAKVLLESAQTETDAAPDIERAVYIQANNRIFGVVFWFILLGPAGAWLFRVLDLMRRRAIWCAEESEQNPTPAMVSAVIGLHRFFAWLPGRLLMVGYTMAGNYDGAVSAWRTRQAPAVYLFPGPDDILLGAVGCGAQPKSAESSVSDRARRAISLVIRTLWMIWCPVIALLTLYGLIS